MVTVTTNISAVINRLKTNFEKLKDKEYLLRPLAIETIANMKERIHKNGEDSTGAQIGTYSNGYLKYRENHGRGKDTKVIVSLTRNLENHWMLVATEKGYGIGFDPLNIKKAHWVEENKGKIIFNLSPAEKEYITKRLKELVDGAINT